jgi:NADH pyrophosphatase NudC (nudix superfamily)
MGGSVEFGESIVECLKRETLEEVGVEIEDIEFLSYTDHILPDEGQHWLGLNFMAIIKPNQQAKNMEPHKFDDVRWFKFGEVPSNLAMPTKESLNLMINRYNEKYQKGKNNE